PYDYDDCALTRLLNELANGWLHKDAVVVVERGGKSPQPTWPEGWQVRKPRKYGEARLWLADVP
ncbi:MAG TPA: RsmD family RNA methyltransferase, partial [Actinomycetales bacterium]|nr:RsmD family RNA methyltransferase [Actinomycetales bacterium]